MKRLLNARLIAAAGTAATEAEAMGYDGRAAIEALPFILQVMADCNVCLSKLQDADGAYRVTVLAETRDALARARGGMSS